MAVTDDYHCRVLLCWPADRKEIARLNAMTRESFTPTVDHSLSTCDGCPRGIWIGPQQLQLSRSPLIRVKKLCMFCAVAVQNVLKLRPEEVDLNPEMNFSRPRTA
jgi:hypothetical protein